MAATSIPTSVLNQENLNAKNINECISTAMDNNQIERIQTLFLSIQRTNISNATACKTFCWASSRGHKQIMKVALPFLSGNDLDSMLSGPIAMIQSKAIPESAIEGLTQSMVNTIKLFNDPQEQQSISKETLTETLLLSAKEGLANVVSAVMHNPKSKDISSEEVRKALLLLADKVASSAEDPTNKLARGFSEMLLNLK